MRQAQSERQRGDRRDEGKSREATAKHPHTFEAERPEATGGSSGHVIERGPDCPWQ